jgi:putative restriction endonuclease
VILNGLPLTKIHHVAFDAHLIGVDLITEFTSPISCSNLMRPVSRTRAEGIAGTLIDRPNRIVDRPDRDRLAIRF